MSEQEEEKVKRQRQETNGLKKTVSETKKQLNKASSGKKWQSKQ